jgi:hypothetical protein
LTFFQTNQSSNNKSNTPTDEGQAHFGRTQALYQKFQHLSQVRNFQGDGTIPDKACPRAGLPFVEALMLASDKDQFEVVCNLLNPTKTSTWGILECMQSWKHVDQIET